MKRIIKNILLTLIVFVLCAVGSAKAATYKVGSAMTVTDHGLITSGFTFGVGGNKIKQYSTANGAYNAYCLDPSGYGYLDSLKIDRELVNNNKATGREYAYETALLSVLENSTNYDYKTITHALRFVKSNMGYAIAGNYPMGQKLTQTFMVTGANWISESADNYTYWYQAFYGTNPPKKLSGDTAKNNVLDALYKTQNYKTNDGISAFTGDATMLSNVKVLFINALRNAATARMNSNSASVQNYKVTLSNAGLINESSKNGATYLSRDVIYSVNTSLYDRLNGFVGGFSVTSKYSRYMTLQYSVDGQNWTNLSSTTNLVSLNASRVYIRLHIEGLKSDLSDCETIGYSISYNYYDPSLMSKGYLLRSTVTGTAGTFPQEFVFYTTDGGSCTKTNDGKGNTCSIAESIPSTTELCGACETEITIPKDCTELGDQVNNEDVIGKIAAPSNVSKCILKKNDDAGNSYMLSKNNGGVDQDNPYCSVCVKKTMQQ